MKTIYNLLFLALFLNSCGSSKDDVVVGEEYSVDRVSQKSEAKNVEQGKSEDTPKSINENRYVDDDGYAYYYDENDNMVYLDKQKEKSNSKKSQPQQFSGKFAKAKSIIASHDGQYICVGDSTRAYSEYNNHYVYEKIKDTLGGYGIESINKAYAGITAKEYASKWYFDDLIGSIDGDGSKSIVDISLGINDQWHDSSNEIKNSLERLISKIRTAKPNVAIILTVPNRVYFNKEQLSNEFISIYKSLSSEFGYPMIDIPHEAMPLDELSSSWYRGDGDNTHLASWPQSKIADVILSKILPD